MAKPRLTKEEQQILSAARDAINALVPEAGDEVLGKIREVPVNKFGESQLRPSGVLKHAFHWADTLQGYGFWESIWKELVAQEKRNES